MPRASWRGFLRLSLVLSPIYLSPATTRARPIRLHQVWRPAPVEEPEGNLPDQGRKEQTDAQAASRRDDSGDDADQSSPLRASQSGRITPQPAKRSESPQGALAAEVDIARSR